jgi:hypothetical protein
LPRRNVVDFSDGLKPFNGHFYPRL